MSVHNLRLPVPSSNFQLHEQSMILYLPTENYNKKNEMKMLFMTEL